MQKISEAIVSGSLQAISEDSKRKDEIKEEFGARAQQVKPYKPNRHQVRAQKKAQRRAKIKKRKERGRT